MVRVYLVLLVVYAAFTLYATFDAGLADSSRVRALPKPVWVIFALVIPIAGGVLWFTLGQPRKGTAPGAGRRASSSSSRGPQGPVAPDDDPDFLRSLGDPK